MKSRVPRIVYSYLVLTFVSISGLKATQTQLFLCGFFLFVCFGFFLLFRAAPMAYGNSQPRG